MKIRKTRVGGKVIRHLNGYSLKSGAARKAAKRMVSRATRRANNKAE